MTTLFFCNIGTRDVAVASRPKPRDEGARPFGEKLLADYESIESDLAFPIVQPVLDYILDRVDALDQLIFIGTDQDETVPEKYRENDSVHYAALAQRYYRQQYPPERIRQITAELVRGIIPSLHDETLPYFGNLLRPYASADKVYLLATGGIQACNTALLLQSVRYFGERCQVMYPREDGSPWPLVVGELVMDVMRESTAITLLQRFDFTAAYTVLSQYAGANRAAVELTQYASARLRFDFTGARDHLDAAIRYSSASRRPQLEAFGAELALLGEQSEKALLGELYHNARIAWENGRYVDFLGRLGRFQEAMLYYLAHHSLAVEAADELALITRPAGRRLLLAALSRLAEREPEGTSVPTEVLAALRMQMAQAFSLGEIRSLCFDLGVDYEELGGQTKTEKIVALIEYMRRRGLLQALRAAYLRQRPDIAWDVEFKEAQGSLLKRVCPMLVRLEQLTPWREKSIIAHGYGGVSRSSLLAAYNEASSGPARHPAEDMAAVCAALEIDTANPFRQVRDVIIHLLQHG